jgi:hypothetical protein
MFTVELYVGIRCAVMVDGLSSREAAKRFGVHRNTIPKMLQLSVPPPSGLVKLDRWAYRMKNGRGGVATCASFMSRTAHSAANGGR